MMDRSRMRDEMNNCLSPHHGMCFQFYEGKGYSTKSEIEYAIAHDKEVRYLEEP